MIIGCDESGNGSTFGGIGTACVYIPNKDTYDRLSWFVKDSKKICVKKIFSLAKKIRECCIYSEHMTSPVEYNISVQNVGYNGTLVGAKLKCLQEIKEKLKEKKITNQTAIIDGNLDERSLNFLNKNSGLKIKCIPKADANELAVSCASILAKDMYLSSMHMISKRWKIKFPFNNNTKIVNMALKLFLDINTSRYIGCVAKRDFKNVKKVLFVNSR